jgi:ubiquinone/menaquinone biosynthesis C-methylase UbiE
LSAKERVLNHSAAQAYYDQFGEKQDSQGFYEDPALDELIAHAELQNIQSVFEFGCGTGKFAVRLFKNHLSSSANYLGCDISPVMISIAKRRLAAYGERAKVALSDGSVRFPCSDFSVDRVVSTYVLDLLSEPDIRRCFSEARRILIPGGKLCLASLTSGVTILSGIISSLWMSIFHLKPAIVGGCRPIYLDSFVDPQEWRVDYKRVVTPFGVPSEVLILASRSTPNK